MGTPPYGQATTGQYEVPSDVVFGLARKRVSRLPELLTRDAMVRTLRRASNMHRQEVAE